MLHHAGGLFRRGGPRKQGPEGSNRLHATRLLRNDVHIIIKPVLLIPVQLVNLPDQGLILPFPFPGFLFLPQRGIQTADTAGGQRLLGNGVHPENPVVAAGIPPARRIIHSAGSSRPGKPVLPSRSEVNGIAAVRRPFPLGRRIEPAEMPLEKLLPEKNSFHPGLVS